MTVIRSLLIWLVTGAAAAALPLIAMAILREHAGYPHDVHTLLATGDLILVAIVMMIGTFGDFALAFWEGRRPNLLDMVVLVGVPLGSLIAMLIYAVNAQLEPVKETFAGDPHGTVTASLWTYGAALAIGWSSIWRKSQEG